MSYTIVSGPGSLDSDGDNVLEPGDGEGVGADATVRITGVGDIVIRATQTGSVAWMLAVAVEQTLSVVRKPVTVTGLVASSKVYDGNTTTGERRFTVRQGWIG